jgi:hypothetical protein
MAEQNPCFQPFLRFGNQRSLLCHIDFLSFSFLLTAQGKRRRSRPLDRRVRPEGQKGAPGLGEGRGPRKSAGPPERRSAATRIAARACCTSASGQKGLKALRTGRSAGMHGCAHKACDGTNVGVQRLPKAVRCNDGLGVGFIFFPHFEIRLLAMFVVLTLVVSSLLCCVAALNGIGCFGFYNFDNYLVTGLEFICFKPD